MGNQMQVIDYGRRKFTFSNGKKMVTSTSITEKSLASEDEEAFTERLMKKYGNQQGTIEIVFKGGRPEYAIITLQ
jgi:hypothetical protein